MKKILIISFLMSWMLGAFAQDHSDGPYNFKYDQTYMLFSGKTASDSISYVSGTKDSAAVSFLLDKTYPVQYYVKVLIDSISNPRIVVSLQGKMFSGDSWTNITSIVYTGGRDASGRIADSTLIYNATSEPSTTILMDTTKRMNRSGEHYLYTGTQTQTTVSKYYRYLRVLAVRTRGKARIREIEIKLWDRKY